MSESSGSSLHTARRFPSCEKARAVIPREAAGSSVHTRRKSESRNTRTDGLGPCRRVKDDPFAHVNDVMHVCMGYVMIQLIHSMEISGVVAPP